MTIPAPALTLARLRLVLRPAGQRLRSVGDGRCLPADSLRRRLQPAPACLRLPERSSCCSPSQSFHSPGSAFSQVGRSAASWDL